uniref:UBR-type domain-containing protein n=1 Tax=Cynoglossus semilaevis TaxID=244447 RepID=A0A3P8WUI8_CYNSE
LHGFYKVINYCFSFNSVCTVCAKVCHKDHEISYAKYGSFFCDCGAKEDGSCQVRPNTSGHHGKRTTAVTLACKSFTH